MYFGLTHYKCTVTFDLGAPAGGEATGSATVPPGSYKKAMSVTRNSNETNNILKQNVNVIFNVLLDIQFGISIRGKRKMAF